MSFDQAAINTLFSNAVSHAEKLGIFRSVNTHEPKSAPGSGLRASIWVDSIKPSQQFSGQNDTAGIVTLNFRIFSNMLQKPEDDIDPAILTAISTLMNEYSGSFTFGGTVLAVDLLGIHGSGLSAQAGYMQVSDGTYRVMTLSVPVIIDALWVQTP